MNKGFFGVNWFTFSSAKQKEKENKAYKKLMYPLGEKQLEWEDEVYNALFSRNKRNDVSTMKYVGLMRREADIRPTLDKEDDDYREQEPAYKEFLDTVKRMKVSKQEAEIIEKIAEIEKNAKSIEDLPVVEEFVKSLKE